MNGGGEGKTVADRLSLPVDTNWPARVNTTVSFSPVAVNDQQRHNKWIGRPEGFVFQTDRGAPIGDGLVSSASFGNFFF